MGIYDRDYMRGGNTAPTSREPAPAVIPLSTILGRGAVVVFSFFMGFILLRAPFPIYVKIPLLVGLGFFIRFLWNIPKKSEGDHHLKNGMLAERREAFDLAIRNYELAAARDPKNVVVRIRLLAAYHGAGRSEKAKELICKLEDVPIPERHVEELEYLVADYYEAHFEKSGSEYRMVLE